MPNFFEKPPADSQLASEYDEVASGEFHDSNLYDQNHDSNGDKVDLATGKAIDNTKDPEESFELPEVTLEDLQKSDKKMRNEDAGDDADEFLRANDPNYGKSGVNSDEEEFI